MHPEFATMPEETKKVIALEVRSYLKGEPDEAMKVQNVDLNFVADGESFSFYLQVT